MRQYHHSRRQFLRRLVFITLLAGASRPALAHARLLRSEPASSASLPEPPATIGLWFNELLDDAFNTLQIFRVTTGPDKPRDNLAKEKPKVDPLDGTHLILKAPPLDPGEYVVEYRVLSRDGHTAPGRFTFKILGKLRK